MLQKKLQGNDVARITADNFKTPKNIQILQQYLRNFLRSQFPNIGEDTEDVIQETFRKAISKVSSFREESSFVTWISTIAKYEYLNLVRHKENQRLRTALRPTDEFDPFANLSNGVTPERIIIAQEMVKKLREWITQNISPRDQQILHSKLEGLEDETIANTLNIPKGTVKSTYFRIKARMTKAGFSITQ